MKHPPPTYSLIDSSLGPSVPIPIPLFFRSTANSIHHVGGTAFLGLGTYTLYSGLSQLREERANLSSAEIAALKFGQRASFLARRMGVWGIGLGLVGAGSYRMFLQ